MHSLEWKWFLFEFHWNLFPGVPLTISSVGLGNVLAPSRRQATTWANVDPVHWRIYAALGVGVGISWLMLFSKSCNGLSSLALLVKFLFECYRIPLWEFKIGSDNGWVSSGNKPLAGPVFTQISDTMWLHWSTMINPSQMIDMLKCRHAGISLSWEINLDLSDKW